MPSVCIHYGPELELSADGFAGLAQALAAAVEEGLGAAPDLIQIMSVRLAHPPLGRPVYVEIKARDTEARGDEVVGAFVDRVDEITHRTLGVRCRIRYFRYPGEVLAAAN